MQFCYEIHNEFKQMNANSSHFRKKCSCSQIIYQMMVSIVVGTACWYTVHTIYNVWMFISSNKQTSLVLL